MRSGTSLWNTFAIDCPGMTLRLTSAPVSGVKKRKSTPKPRSSPFAAHARRKPTSAATAAVKAAEEIIDDDPLPDIGGSRFISETAEVRDVVQAIQSIRTRMFDQLPQRAGMNSTRIAEVLNLRRSLPPLASVAHVHTLLNAPTQVEREIVELLQSGRVRRLVIPGRGSDAAGLGDCLVLAEDWEEMVRGSDALEDELKEKFLDILTRIGSSSALSQSVFTPDEYRALIRAGFLVSSSSYTQASLNVASLPNLPQAVVSSASRRGPAHLSDTDRAVQTDAQARAATLFLSLPNTGTYLRLLGAGRAHLLALLRRSTCNEAPLQLLKDRWDGAVETEKSFHLAKRARGEFAGVLPGRTKKWKDLYGMQFRWVLEEALGAGLVEIFETGSVGPGIRCLSIMSLLQLQPHPFTSIPPHPSFTTDSSRPDLQHYISTALHEALDLLHSIPAIFTADPKLRPSPPSQANVKLLRGWRKPSEPVASSKGRREKDKPEFWVCRQSQHVNESSKGTASWREFEAGLRSEHAEHEMEYTPSVSGVERLLEWAPESIGGIEVDGVRFEAVNMEVNLITHTFHPSVLISPRTFISLTISAAYEGLSYSAAALPTQSQREQRQGFLTVQIPLHPAASSTPEALLQKISASVPKRTIFANYASIERVELLPADTPTDEVPTEQSQSPQSRIEWTMATTSDAGGSIPQWVQRSWALGGVPRAVVADVGLFIGWTMRRRQSS
ncbi:hypothetical protein F1880_005678 [Penicillium rolfsii]|nr:hypothetical protein F1880_005678 [Penicillium rolfsii]